MTLGDYAQEFCGCGKDIEVRPESQISDFHSINDLLADLQTDCDIETGDAAGLYFSGPKEHEFLEAVKTQKARTICFILEDYLAFEVSFDTRLTETVYAFLAKVAS